jgi:hypothetical protein
VEEKAAEVGPEMEPEALAIFVHEATPVVEEKDVPAALVGDVAALVKGGPYCIRG